MDTSGQSKEEWYEKVLAARQKGRTGMVMCVVCVCVCVCVVDIENRIRWDLPVFQVSWALFFPP